MMNLDVIFGKFKYFPCDTATDLLRIASVLEVHVVREHFDFV